MATHIFYFVRHGQSILNAKGIRQGSAGQLSEKGVEQAHITGERLAEEQTSVRKKMDVILASPYDRTRETAAIIAEHLHIEKPIEYIELFRERRNPSSIIGKSADDYETGRIIDLMDRSYHSDDFRFADEENFSDLRDRAKACLEFLEKRASTMHEKRVVVVTHGIFLKMLIAYLIHRDELNAQEYNKLSFLNPANNAGITVCTYDAGLFDKGYFAPKKPGLRWQLIAWDQHTETKGRNTTI
jgi:broad specificity phosphatase PhoE